jgi:hypothetical protein
VLIIVLIAALAIVGLTSRHHHDHNHDHGHDDNGSNHDNDHNPKSIT